MNAVSSGGFALVGGNGVAVATEDPCECCNDSAWNRADLCNAGDAPPEVPRKITFRKGFVCLDGCPVSGGRIIVYRGYCYFVEGGAGEVDCGGPRTKPAEYPEPVFGATQAAWAELLCKSLAADCLNESCVPVEPGCCTRPYQINVCTGLYQCNLPKRFRIRQIARYRYVSTTYTDPGQCAGLVTCEDLTIDIDVWADYACDEENVGPDGLSSPVCYATGGAVVISGLNRISSQDPPINLNGTYPARPPSEQDFRGKRGWINAGPASGPVKWVPDALFGEFLFQFNQGFCSGQHSYGIDDPPGCSSSSEVCPSPGVIIRQRSVNCNYQTESDVEYEDCWLYDRLASNVGYSAPPCNRDLRWSDSIADRVTIANLAHCQKQPIIGDPIGVGRPAPSTVVGDAEPAQMATWLGVNWRGTPFPIRLWEFVTKGTPLGKDPGCGCIDRLKSLAEKPKV